MKRISLCESWVFWEKEKSEDSLVQESGEECGKRREQVTLPHDAMQGQGRAADAPSGSGEAFFLGGSYVYERRLWAPKAWENEEVLLEFEGVYPNAAVYVNGERAGGCRYGYSLFRVPLEHLRWGADNEIRVEVDGSRLPNSRWYPGAGIYRPVWLLTGSRKAHIEPDGIRVTTLSCGAVESRSETQAEILIEVSHTGCQSRGSAQPSVRVLAEIYEWGQERKVTEAEGEQIHLVIPEARLWDENSPALYECRVSLWDGEKLLDTQSERFGIRRIGWSPQGLTVNGRTVKLRGGCLHHDNGILGARSFAESEYRRIRRLKEWGFNAIRSAHNPACRALLEACDELGVYVMDEAWDVWDKSKTAEDYAGEFPAHYEEDLASMAAKDYNHPSVILYSIGNEMTEPAQPEGVVLAEQIIRKLKACDGTRPVTAGVNLTLLLMAKMGVGIPSAEQPESPAAEGAGNAEGTGDAERVGDTEGGGERVENTKRAGSTEAEGSERGGEGGGEQESQSMVPDTSGMDSTAYNKMVSEMGNRMLLASATPEADEIASPVLELLDIAGYNYASPRYAQEGILHPERIVVGSETYPYELSRNWEMVERYPYLIGDFMWTAWDYLGEAGIGGWSYDEEDRGFQKRYPWLLADTGAFDILGNDNAEAGLARAVWKPEAEPYLAVSPLNHPGVVPSRAIWRGSNAIPHWSYAGCDGNAAEAEVYSAAGEIELFLNGKSVGRKKPEDHIAKFSLCYEPGELRAVAYRADGSEHSQTSLRSAAGRLEIRILPERESVRCGDILYLSIDLTGENGEIECARDTRLRVSVEGGELLAFGSANPKTAEDFLAGSYTTYYGRSQAVVRAGSGRLIVRVEGVGLEEARCEIPVRE